MKKYKIYSSELVLYETIVEASSEEEAWEKVASTAFDSDKDEVDRTGFQTDNIEECYRQ